MKRATKWNKLATLAGLAIRDNLVKGLDYEQIADEYSGRISEVLTPKRAEKGLTNVENLVDLVNSFADHCERQTKAGKPYPKNTKIGEVYSLMQEVWGGRLEFGDEVVDDSELDDVIADIRANLKK